MAKKQYKVKIENGKIIPLEPIDLVTSKEGIIIFLDEEVFESTPKSLLKYSGAWVGNDFEECLKHVYETRGKTKF